MTAAKLLLPVQCIRVSCPPRKVNEEEKARGNRAGQSTKQSRLSYDFPKSPSERTQNSVSFRMKQEREMRQDNDQIPGQKDPPEANPVMQGDELFEESAGSDARAPWPGCFV